MDIMQAVEKEIMPLNRSIDFEVGDTVRVDYRIIDGEKDIKYLIADPKDIEKLLKHKFLFDKAIANLVLHYAKNAKKAGLNGIVCSPLEVLAVKKELGNNFVTIAPGIRFDNKNAGDQVRITTPKQAGKTGTDFIVVGRPITKAKDPQAAYNQCLQDFLED
jgi:orotidine-5'-phosphate decarboxylase